MNFSNARFALAAFLFTCVFAALCACFVPPAYADEVTDADQVIDYGKPAPKPTKAGWTKDKQGTWYYFKSVSSAPTTGWLSQDGKWYYLDPDKNGALQVGWFEILGPNGSSNLYISNGSGAIYTNRWINLPQDGHNYWYYATNSGALKTGWFKSGGKWYWLSLKDGMMAVDCWLDLDQDGTDDYRFTASGAMATGWIKEFDQWYLFNSSGQKVTGWQKRDGKWYYLDPDKGVNKGALQIGKFDADNKTYYSDKSGALYINRWFQYEDKWYFASSAGEPYSGWVKSSGKWYYLQPGGGAMANTGWLSVEGKDYYFKKSGVMATGWVSSDNTWFYLDKSGAKKTGWVKSDGKWYYLNSNANGSMVKNETLVIDGESYSFDSSGALK